MSARGFQNRRGPPEESLVDEDKDRAGGKKTMKEEIADDGSAFSSAVATRSSLEWLKPVEAGGQWDSPYEVIVEMVPERPELSKALLEERGGQRPQEKNHEIALEHSRSFTIETISVQLSLLSPPFPCFFAESCRTSLI